MRFALVFFVLMSSSYSLFSQLRLAKVFADQMVLQRGKPIPVWGWGVPGEQVSVSLELDRQEATVDPNGKWKLEMPTREAGGPYVFEVRSGIETVVFRDVWVGEVWLCSGQSNMEWEVRLAENPGFERQNARDSLIHTGSGDVALHGVTADQGADAVIDVSTGSGDIQLTGR